MRELNLFTYGDLTSANHIQGKAFVGGSLNGNATVGQGNGAAGAAASARPTLAVAGDVNAGLTLQNGSNGGGGAVAAVPAAVVGGSVRGTANTNPDGWGLAVGGDLAALANVNGGPAISVGGSYGGSNTGNGRIVHDASLAAGGSADLHAALDAERAGLGADFTALSGVLAGLSANGRATTNGSTLTLDFAGAAGSGYGAYTIDAATLFGYGTLDIRPGTGADGALLPVVVNVTGEGAYADRLNMNLADGIAQDVIFNLTDASGLAVGANWTGSLLATHAAVTNSANITGSVVAGSLVQGAEIHLGTYAGSSALIPAAPGAVPEASTWAMMLAGFGAVGSVARRQRRPTPSLA